MRSFIERTLPAPVTGGFTMQDYWVWCGSVIRGDDGLYHMFASRWPKRYPFFRGYVVYSEIVRAVSATPEGPYIFAEVVLPARGAGFWDGRMTHNPTIHKYGGSYLLYYIGSTHGDEDPSPEMLQGQCQTVDACYKNIRIGLAIAPSVNGPWQRADAPILLPRKDKWDSTVVTNPAVCIEPGGSILLYYRSNTPAGLRIGLARADAPDAPYTRVVDDPVLAFPGNNYVEDPFVWRTDDGYAMIAKDMTGGITGERHAGMCAVSRDGLRWELATPPKAYSRRVVWSDGSVTMQGSFERPQLLFDGGVPTHLFTATGDGSGGFDNVQRTWNMVTPLRN